MPVLLVLAGCGNDLESRNAALGFEDDGTSDIVFTRQTPRGSGSARQIDGLGNVDQVSDDFAIMDGPEAGPETAGVEGDDDDGPTIIDASPDDLRDLAQGFAPDPVDDASGIDPSPILSDPVGD
ncbi:hypothetical protein AAV99_13275 [Aurantiacibacter marinus]|uniref:Uncharacterized protein n=1 Tax=Aurantiacibacter marinus TaxID=874156 RepID=A0A0H0XKY7_9SPHN|nr:hypothetical protein AAV99_13275 [Aurantiacibacter marinus]